MTLIDVTDMDYKMLNEQLRKVSDDCSITGCCGQRFIAAGMSNRSITIEGVPGNALGAYLNGASITVHANAQDAVGDTMNEGQIIIHGNIGDPVIASNQTYLCFAYTEIVDILHGRISISVLKYMGYIAGTQ